MSPKLAAFYDAAALQSLKTSLLATILAAENGMEIKEVTKKADSFLSTHELRELYIEIEKHKIGASRQEFRRNAYLANMLKKDELQLTEYQNIALSSHARFFYCDKTNAHEKCLIIFFSCAGGMIGMGNCLFLSKLPLNRCDVLFLNRHRHYDYRYGVPGIGEGIVDTCLKLQEILSSERYAGVCCIGFSMGGLWALRTAILMNTSIGVALSGTFAIKKREDSPFDNDIEYDPLSEYSNVSSAKLFCFHSEHSKRDADDALKFQELFPRTKLKVLEAAKEHNIFALLSAQRKLDTFLSEMVHGTIYPEELSW
ncbi:MAG: hypothetical protein R2880_04340 [Deinococcales bacterium]